MKGYNIGNFVKYGYALKKNFTQLLLYNLLPVPQLRISRYFVILRCLTNETN